MACLYFASMGSQNEFSPSKKHSKSQKKSVVARLSFAYVSVGLMSLWVRKTPSMCYHRGWEWEFPNELSHLKFRVLLFSLWVVHLFQEVRCLCGAPHLPRFLYPLGGNENSPVSSPILNPVFGVYVSVGLMCWWLTMPPSMLSLMGGNENSPMRTPNNTTKTPKQWPPA